MPTATSHKNGLPCWADLASTDPAAARAFYAAVLGWTFDEPSPEFGHYSNCLLNTSDAAPELTAAELVRRCALYNYLT